MIFINLGTSDVGILNYAYALEQLESAFYTQVVSMSNSGTVETKQHTVNIKPIV